MSCAQCGAELTLTPPGGLLCPACLLGLGLGLDDEPGNEPGKLPGLIAPIGRGPVATAFLGRRPDRRRHLVSVKLIEAAVDGERFAAAVRELGRQIKALQIDAVAPILDAGISQDLRAFVVSPYVPGPDLREYWNRNAGRQEHRTRVILDLCRALSALHREGIIHGSVKAENVIVSPPHGTVVLLDTGVRPALQRYRFPHAFESASPPLPGREALEADVRDLHVLIAGLLSEAEAGDAGSPDLLARLCRTDCPYSSPAELARDLKAILL